MAPGSIKNSAGTIPKRMEIQPGETDISFAARVLRKRAESFLKELTQLRQKPGEESIHDTRVQSRRMRAALEAFRDLLPQHPWHALYDSIRRITKALGVARETEVNLQLLKDLTGGGDMAENLCREYLEEGFGAEFRQQQKKMYKKLRAIKVISLQSQIETLLAGLEGAEASDPAPQSKECRGTARRIRRPRQAALFPMHEQPGERARRVLDAIAATILAFRPRRDFKRASDLRLHKLRIATKKLRYSFELFDEIWPSGLKNETASARAFQDAAGRHQDAAMMQIRLRGEIQRLTKQKSPHLAFQLGRLLARVQQIKAELRAAILPPLMELQAGIQSLPHQTTQPSEPGPMESIEEKRS